MKQITEFTPGKNVGWWHIYPTEDGTPIPGLYSREHPQDRINKRQFCMKGELIGLAIATDTTAVQSASWVWSLWAYEPQTGNTLPVKQGTWAEVETWAKTHYWHPLTRELRPGDVVRLREPYRLEGADPGYDYALVSQVEARTGRGLVKLVWVNPMTNTGLMAFAKGYIEAGLMVPLKVSMHLSELTPYHFPDRGGYYTEHHPAAWGELRCFNQ